MKKDKKNTQGHYLTQDRRQEKYKYVLEDTTLIKRQRRIKQCTIV